MRQSNNGVLQGVPSQAPRSDLGLHGRRRAIARCPCTPQGPVEVRGEKINASSSPSKEIAGLNTARNAGVHKSSLGLSTLRKQGLVNEPCTKTRKCYTRNGRKKCTRNQETPRALLVHIVVAHACLTST